MAENTVVKEYLTDAMIEGGAEFTSRLDETALTATAAYWFFDTEINEWLFMVVSPEISTKGPRWVYEQIYKALAKMGPKANVFPFAGIRILEPRADLPRALSATFHTGPEVRRIRLHKEVVDNRYVEDALVYRAA